MKTLPSVYELISDDLHLARQLREVQVEDVLGREQVEVDLEAVAKYIRDRTVLVSGAGGSIGSTLPIAAFARTCVPSIATCRPLTSPASMRSHRLLQHRPPQLLLPALVAQLHRRRPVRHWVGRLQQTNPPVPQVHAHLIAQPHRPAVVPVELCQLRRISRPGRE